MLDPGQSVRRADTDFVKCPTFHYVVWTDHKFVRVNLRLADRLSLAGYWKFNNALLEIWDFWDQLESLVQRALVGAFTGNKWWGSLKQWIRIFSIKYGRQLNLDRTKLTKSLEDKLSWALDGGDSLTVDLSWWDLEREDNKHYKGYVVRSRLKRSREMQRVSTWGRSTKAPLSSYWIGQITGRARARLISWDAWHLGARGPRGIKRQRQSCADQFKSVHGLR